MIDRPRLRRKDVPEHLRIKHGNDIRPATLRKLACVGGGPPMQYMGRIPLYHVEDLDALVQIKLS